MKIPSLRPCPFCECDVVNTVKIGPRSWVAECDWCEARTGPRRTKQAAIISWNERERRDLNYQIWCLIEIRRIVGDPEGRLMQSELIEKVRELVERREAAKVKNQPPDLTAGEFNRGE